MKRDMDLVRKVLLELETKTRAGEIKIEGYSDAQVGYHCYLIADAGLAVGGDVTPRGSEGPKWQLFHLTWAGHDFLDAAREPSRWEKAKSVVSRIGGVSMAVLIEILKQLTAEQVRKVLG